MKINYAWTLSEQGRGSRSCIHVTGIVFCAWKVNSWSILWLLDFWVFVFQTSLCLIICLDRVRWDGGITFTRIMCKMVENPPVEVAPDFAHYPCKDNWEEAIGEPRREEQEGLSPCTFLEMRSIHNKQTSQWLVRPGLVGSEGRDTVGGVIRGRLPFRRCHPTTIDRLSNPTTHPCGLWYCLSRDSDYMSHRSRVSYW